MRLCAFSRPSFFLGLVLPLLSFAGRAQHPTLHTTPDAGKTPAAAAPEPKPAANVPAPPVGSRSVILPVVVRDKSGALVENLSKADLSLEVDNHPQTIASFAQDSTLPLTIGLLVDGSPSQRGVLEEERSAASAFLDGMLLKPSDQAFVVEFAGKIELLQDLTNSKPKLQSALKDLEAATPAPQTARSKTSDDEDEGSSRRSRTAADTTLYDAVFLAADELMAKQIGRKVVILLAGGYDRNSKETLTNALEAAQRADTILYAIYLKGEEPRRLGNNGGNSSNYPNGGSGYPGNGRQGGGYPGGGYPGGGYPGGGYPGGGYPGGGYPGGGYPGGGCPGGTNPNSTPAAPNVSRKTLERLTNETGGRMFELSRKQKMTDILTEIAKELRAQYRLSYTPNGATAGDGYHQVDLSLAGPDKKRLILQTRDGYYTGK